MWLFFPMTVLMHRAAYDPRPAVRAGTWALLAVAGGLMLLSLPVFPIDLQAFGNNLAATVVLVAGLGWHMLHPLVAAASTRLPPAARGLQRRAGHNPPRQATSWCPTQTSSPASDPA